MARYDDLNTKMIAYWAVLSIIVLVLLLQLLQALCFNMVTMTETKPSRHPGSEVDRSAIMKSEQLKSLNGYKKEKVVDESAPAPEKGQEPAKKDVIHIPIDRAQDIILKEFAPSQGA
jgi:hypothetical protein